jgi:hypothetical protein
MRTLAFTVLWGAAISVQAQWAAKTECFKVRNVRDTLVYVNDKPVWTYRFDGVQYDDYGLPYYFVASADEIVLEENPGVLVNDERFTLPDELFAVDDFYPSAVMVEGPTFTTNKVRYRSVRFYPFRVHQSGVVVEKRQEIRYRIEPKAFSAAKTAEDRVYTERSVLADGPWFKLCVSADGVYIVDKKLLQDMGINPADVDPRTLKIYGRPGGMLPQANNAFRHDDLPQLAVHAVGQDDGVFHDSDYLVFYGQGPRRVFWYAAGQEYRHENHLYSGETCYFLTYGGAPGKRIQTRPPGDGGTETFDYTCVEIWDEDKENIGRVGRMWFGDKFDFVADRNYSFALNDVVGPSVRIQTRTAANSLNPTYMLLRASGAGIVDTVFYPANNAGNTVAQLALSTAVVPASSLASGRLDLTLSYVKNGVSQAWLDFIRVSYQRKLAFSGAFYPFYLPPSGATRRLTLERYHSGYMVWDVSDPVVPVRQDGAVDGQKFSFSGTGTHWIAFSSSAFTRPKFVGRVANQNLHGLSTPDYVIVTHPLLTDQAHRLGEFHRSRGLSVHVVDVEQVYNEFSSGTADATAIRDFAKMMYDRGGLQFLALFGDGSFDNRNLMNEGGLIPTYQARQSMRTVDAYCGEDYFGMLDDDEGEWREPGLGAAYEQDGILNQVQTLDIGVGRFPVSTPEQARVAVDKIIRYAGPSFGPWRTQAVLIADFYRQEINHIHEADSLDRLYIQKRKPLMNVEKIYISQFPAQNQADGLRFPKANQAIVRNLNRGSLFVNYTGHGGETGLSNSYILESEDIAALKNGEKTPFWITATCNFGQFDRGKTLCGAEQAFVNPDGGAIALLTANREVYSTPNYWLNVAFYVRAFEKSPDGRYRTFGEIIRDCKNDIYTGNGYRANDLNTRTFCLLGDPALKPMWPKHELVVTELTDSQNQPVSTVKALGRYTLRGEVRSTDGRRIEDWNGKAYITVFDKPQTFRTLLGNIEYRWQKNRLFTGLASVNDGKFQISFVIPADISYDEGEGKISLYAHNDVEDAAGYFNRFVVCCTDSAAVRDDTPPTVKVYIDGEDWRIGSLTSPNPELWVRISDDTGINATGLGLGRDITAILDGDESQPIRLNEYFSADMDAPSQGWVKFPMANLPEGPHHVSVKAWDVANNSATGETRFVVGNKFAVDGFYAYPNPSFGEVGFVFNHNRGGEPLEASLTVSDALGRTVFRVRETFTENTSTCRRFVWDGKHANGAPAGDGIYFAKIRLTDVDGVSVTAHTRIVKMH